MMIYYDLFLSMSLLNSLNKPLINQIISNYSPYTKQYKPINIGNFFAEVVLDSVERIVLHVNSGERIKEETMLLALRSTCTNPGVPGSA